MPSGVSATFEKSIISVKGPKGTVKRELKVHGVEVTLKDGKLEVDGKNVAVINTVKRQVLKMIEGCTSGFSSKMIIRYSHFPIKVSVKGNVFVIDNFGGEKLQRKADIVGDTKNGLVSVNFATAAELDVLSGVGPVTAQKIIDNRPYQSLDELVTKKAISASLYDKLKDTLSL